MPEPSLPKAALLCIDDDQAVLECERTFLETFGYTVVTASSGPEGLKLAGLHSPSRVTFRCHWDFCQLL